jgi:hypothetical protein
LIIFQTDSNSIKIDTSDLHRWAHVQPELWKRFENGDQKALDDLSMYVQDDEEFNSAFKEYRIKLSRNGNPYPFW